MRLLWGLFTTFFRIGIFTIGGGYVMLPVIQKEVVEKKKWVTNREIIDYYAIGQSTPGIIAVNTSTFVGYRVGRIPGAVFATLGMIMPSLCIIMVLAAFFAHFQDYAVVKHAFGGIAAAVAALLVNSVIKLGRKAIVDRLGIVLALIAFTLIVVIEISPVWIIIGSASLGIFLHSFRKKG